MLLPFAALAVSVVVGCGELLVLESDPPLASTDDTRDGSAGDAPSGDGPVLDGGDAGDGGDADASVRCTGAFEEPVDLKGLAPAMGFRDDRYARLEGDDDTTLYFQSTVSGKGRLFRATKTGPDTYGALTELFTDANFAADDVFEPFPEDGKVFFSRQHSAGADIHYGIQPAGSSTTYATTASKRAFNRGPYLTGTHIFFATHANGAPARIAIATRTGVTFGAATELDLGTNSDEDLSAPVVSQDGRTLFFESFIGAGNEYGGVAYMMTRESVAGNFITRETIWPGKVGIVPSYLTSNGCRLYVHRYVGAAFRLAVANRKP